MKLKYCLVLALAMLILCSTSAFAAVSLFSVNYKMGSTPGTWIYTLRNNDLSGDAVLVGLDLYWDDPMAPDYWSITATPAGWAIYEYADCPAWDAILNVPGPGAGLTGFVVASPTPATQYTVYYSTTTDLEEYGDVVPEPSSMLALMGGVAAIGAMIRRRRA